MTVAVRLDERWWLCDTGFGMSLIRPIPIEDGREAEHYGWRSRVRRVPDGWELDRLRDGGWQRLHYFDDCPVEPIDPVVGHHYTSTHPDSHFRAGLMLSRYLPDEHVTVTSTTVTVRRAGQPTEHRDLLPNELTHWLRVLQVPLTFDEQERLIARLA